MAAQPDIATVRLLIFSGRPDPEWALDETAAQAFAERVRRSVGAAEIHPAPAGGLGYRGFIVRTSGALSGVPTELQVYRGVVTEQPGARASHWQDVGKVEEFLLRDARRRGHGSVLDAAGVKEGREGQGTP